MNSPIKKKNRVFIMLYLAFCLYCCKNNSPDRLEDKLESGCYYLPFGQKIKYRSTLSDLRNNYEIKYREIGGLFFEDKDSILRNYQIFLQYEGVTSKFYGNHKSVNRVLNELKDVEITSFKIEFYGSYQEAFIKNYISQLYKSNFNLTIDFDDALFEKEIYTEYFRRYFYSENNGEKYYFGSIVSNKTSQVSYINISYPVWNF